MNINNTNPDNPPERYKPRKIDWDWRDAVVDALHNKGVPRETAGVVVIDLREALDTCAKGKLNPEQTAEMLIPRVQELYNNGVKY